MCPGKAELRNNNQVIRDGYLDTRDRIAAGPILPDWLKDIHNGHTSAVTSSAEDCEIFIDCADFVVGDNCN